MWKEINVDSVSTSFSWILRRPEQFLSGNRLKIRSVDLFSHCFRDLLSWKSLQYILILIWFPCPLSSVVKVLEPYEVNDVSSSMVLQRSTSDLDSG